MRTALFLILLLLFLAVTIALSRAAERAVDVYADMQTRPSSAVETVLQSRQTPPLPNAARGGSGVGWFAFALVIVGACVAVLRSGGEFLRQWRLLRRRQRPSHPPQVVPPAPQRQLPPVSEVQNAE